MSGARLRLLEKVEKTTALLRKLNRWIINIGLVGLFATMIIDTLNIVGIGFGVRIIPGGKTIIEELMTMVVYIGLAYVYFERGHIQTDLLKRRFPPLLNWIANIISFLVIIFVSGFIFWTNGKVAIEYFEQHITSPAAIPIPMGPFFLIIALSFLNIGVSALLFLAAECIGGPRQKKTIP